MSFNYRPITFTLAFQHVDYLTKSAATRGVTRSSYLRNLIEGDMREHGVEVKPIESNYAEGLSTTK